MDDFARKRLARLSGKAKPTLKTPKMPSEWTDEAKKEWRKKIIAEVKAAGKSHRTGKDGSIIQINGSEEFFPTQVFTPPWKPLTLADLMKSPSYESPPIHEFPAKEEAPSEPRLTELEPTELAPSQLQPDINSELSQIAGEPVHIGGKPRTVFRFPSGAVFERDNRRVEIRLKKGSFTKYEDSDGREVEVINCDPAPGLGFVLQNDGTWLPLNNKEDRTPATADLHPMYQPPAKPKLLTNLCDHPNNVCVGHCDSPLYEQTPLSRAPKGCK